MVSGVLQGVGSVMNEQTNPYHASQSNPGSLGEPVSIFRRKQLHILLWMFVLFSVSGVTLGYLPVNSEMSRRLLGVSTVLLLMLIRWSRYCPGVEFRTWEIGLIR